jgi:hypothetical protein
VAGALLRDAGGDDVAAHEVRERGEPDAPALAAHEEHVVLGPAHELRAGLGDVLLDPGDGSLADGHDTVLGELPQADHDDAPRPVEVVDVQVRELGPAHAGRVERLQDRAVADADGVLHVRHHEDLLSCVSPAASVFETWFPFPS